MYHLFEDKHKDTPGRSLRKENHVGMMDSNRKQGHQKCAHNDRKQCHQSWIVNDDREPDYKNWSVNDDREPDHQNWSVENQYPTRVENTVANIHIEQRMNVKYIETDSENDDDLLISHVHEPIKQKRLHKYERVNSNDENGDRKNHSVKIQSTTGSVNKSGFIQRDPTDQQMSSFVDDASPESSWIQDPSSENGNLNSKEIGRKEVNVTESGDFEMFTDRSGNIPSDNKLQTNELNVSSNNITDDDMEVSDLEYDSASETEINSNNNIRQNHRHNVQKRKIPRQDSTRKYISVHTPRRNPKTAFSLAPML